MNSFWVSVFVGFSLEYWRILQYVSSLHSCLSTLLPQPHQWRKPSFTVCQHFYHSHINEGSHLLQFVNTFNTATSMKEAIFYSLSILPYSFLWIFVKTGYTPLIGCDDGCWLRTIGPGWPLIKSVLNPHGQSNWDIFKTNIRIDVIQNYRLGFPGRYKYFTI